jgi:tetrahydromethanopterin S-methyltransferase subunit G
MSAGISKTMKVVVNRIEEVLWTEHKDNIDNLNTRLDNIEHCHGEVARDYKTIQDDIAAVMVKAADISDPMDRMDRMERRLRHIEAIVEGRLRESEREVKEMTDRCERLDHVEARLTKLKNQSPTSAPAGSC